MLRLRITTHSPSTAARSDRATPPLRFVACAALALACGSESSFDGTKRDPATGGSASGSGGTSGSGGSSSGGDAGGATGGSSTGGTATGGSATGGAATGGDAGSAMGGTAGSATGGDAGSATGGTAGAATGGTAGSGAGGTAGSGVAGSGTSGAGSGGAPTNPPPGMYGTRSMLPAANSEMAVAEANGKIYVLGGYPSSGESVTTVQVYDVATDTWGMAAALPEPLHHPVAIGVAGKIYSLGGQIGRSASVDTTLTIVLDPVANMWSTLAPMPTARGAGASAAIGDKIYVVGGRPPAGNAFEVYDISDNAWTPLPDLPTAANERNHIAATAIGGKVYVAGGRYNGGSFSSPMTDRLDIYDPVANAWTPGAALPRPRGGLNGIAAFGCFFTWGGEGGNIGEPNNVFPDHDVYNPRTNQWTSLPDLPTPIHGVTGAAFVNGLIYMPGGGTQQGGSSGSRIFQVYRPMMSCE
jgi:N-acetylneuraminic acid mutarotase